MNYKTSSSLDHQRKPIKTQVLNPFLSAVRDAQANIPNSGTANLTEEYPGLLWLINLLCHIQKKVSIYI